jgi:mRNA interferase MazF
MKAGDVVLAALPQADAQIKHRPAIVLRVMRPYGDLLVCGVSTQLQQEVRGFDKEARGFLLGEP